MAVGRSAGGEGAPRGGTPNPPPPPATPPPQLYLFPPRGESQPLTPTPPRDALRLDIVFIATRADEQAPLGARVLYRNGEERLDQPVEDQLAGDCLRGPQHSNEIHR